MDIRIKYEAALVANRLRAMGEWTDRGYETHYQRIFAALGGHIPDVAAIDRMLVVGMGAHCEIVLPDIDFWLTEPLNRIPWGFTATRMDQ